MALLQAWEAERPAKLPLVHDQLSEAQLSAIEDARGQSANLQARDAVGGFLFEVFQALPDPVLLSTGDGVLWNRAFDEPLGRNRREAPEAPVSVMRRFLLLLDQGREFGDRRLLVPLGHHAWRARILSLPGGQGAAVYLSRLAIDTSGVPPRARPIVLYKVSGLTHKQIALLCGSSKSHVDHVSAMYRSEFHSLRIELCRDVDR